jgi:Protein of unknown function (DUF1670)
MIIDRKAMLQDRLAAKDLDHQFRNRVEHGMGCSPFVSEAIVKAVHEIYLPVLDSISNIKPGQIIFQCLSKRNGSTSRIADAEQITIVLTLDNGMVDQEVRKQKGIDGLRRFRLIRVCNEAYNQGGLLTVEDIAYRLFNVGERTIVRDLALIRKDGENPPLRSTIKDIGRTVTHKAILIKNWLKGDELSDLNRKYNHSFSAIESYINTFKRVVFLDHEGYTIDRIAYVQKISASLVTTYLTLWKEHKNKAIPHRVKEILEIIGTKVTPKKTKQRVS